MFLFEEDICRNCDLHKGCKSIDIPAIGSDTPDVYILNEYPSNREDLMGKSSLLNKPIYLIVHLLINQGLDIIEQLIVNLKRGMSRLILI